MAGAGLARSRFLLSLLLGVGLVAGCGQPGSAPENLRAAVRAVREEPPALPEAVPAVELRVVTFKELEEAVQAHKGKVVVVDVWATWCRSCKKEFPHLVELHHKYRNDVVCVSVSVDDEPDRDLALEYLREQEATFPNYLLNEDAGVWQEQWRTKGVPVVFVYDRDGKRARKFDNDDPDNQFTYADVNKLVEGLLAPRQ